MRWHTVRVMEIRLDGPGSQAALIECPPDLRPAAGQFAMAWDGAPNAPLAAVVFPGAAHPHGFWAAGPTPPDWQPGSALHLAGPFGHGFQLPHGLRRLALVSLGSLNRLLPLAESALQAGADVAVFADTPLQLPPDSRLRFAAEAAPLEALAENLDWPDLLAIDLAGADPADSGLHLPGPLRCPAQVLVTPPMPCGGPPECGVCAVRTRQGWRLACQDGPVFDAQQLFSP